MTPRELEVLEAFRRGARSLGAVARALDPPISSRTAEAYVTSIAGKIPSAFEPDTTPFLRVLLFAVLEGEGFPESGTTE